jgi:nucleoside-diphosphate-sugar epimerase
MVADITKISKKFDWNPKIDIDQGLTLTIKKGKEKKENNN